ncbi:helix-turn-helix domain-containing protein [Streptococcus gallolyticus]|uniref:helix-turn-helix domain-containing protein n=1 Tax=Streptococcus gallolyticus TaxID=315405 RepID=UPI000E3FA6C0|nr:helix-turn-helix transcriptional regulator [Streptococcus gallolyticus]RGC38169.1 XRE family transcriptional regulator [Streptococcus gallolyticus]
MLYEVIKKKASDKKVSIYKIEKELGLSNGSIRKWNTSVPSAITLSKVASYLDVSVEELLEKNEN